MKGRAWKTRPSFGSTFLWTRSHPSSQAVASDSTRRQEITGVKSKLDFQEKSLLDTFRNEFQNYKSEYFPFWFCSLTSNCGSKVLIVDLIHEGQFRSLILAFFTSNGSAMFLPVSRSHEVVPEQLIGSTSSRLTHLCAACLPEPELTPLTPTQCL